MERRFVLAKKQRNNEARPKLITIEMLTALDNLRIDKVTEMINRMSVAKY